MLLRFRRRNTDDQASNVSSERPRRGIDTGNHFEFFGGRVTVGAMPTGFRPAAQPRYDAGLDACKHVVSLQAVLTPSLRAG